MNTQILQSIIRSTPLSSTIARSLAIRAMPQVRQYTQSTSTPPKTIMLFGKEYSKKRVYTVGGLVLLADLAIFDYYYFFKKEGKESQ
ncbi:hypothetical protein ABW19_dt0201414 [Dactylella cylindrospora]|nr:hypothetical protein ABW19_dt0201414 [Dactylella cylindrospora]